MSTQQRVLQYIGMVCLIFLLTACNRANENPSLDYVKRLQNVLDVTEAVPIDTLAIEYPSPRELKVKRDSQELSIREFLSLRECELHKIIAARNSLIGKVAVSSQRLFSDLNILHAGPPCLLKLNTSGQVDLAKKLKQFLATKRAALPASLWQALLGADENAKFWSLGPKIDDYPNQLAHESVPDIQALLKFAEGVLNGKYEYSQRESKSIERHLGSLRHGDGGRLLREYVQLSFGLDQANVAIEQRLNRPMCLKGQATTDARYFQNVVKAWFIAKVQLHAISLERRYEQLMPRYLELEEALADVAPSSYQRWAERRQELMARGGLATKRHAHTIQQLFRQCGLTPGTPPS